MSELQTRVPGWLVMVGVLVAITPEEDRWHQTWREMAGELVPLLPEGAEDDGLREMIAAIRAVDDATRRRAEVAGGDRFEDGTRTPAAIAQFRARARLIAALDRVLKGRVIEGLELLERAGLRAVPDRVA